MQGILCVYQSGVKVVDLPLRDKQTITLVQRDACAMRHCSFEDLWVHSRDLESMLLPPRVECIDRVLQVVAPRAILAWQRLPSSVGHCLSTSHMRSKTSMLVDHLLLVEDLLCVGELHAP
jgi:hypothetical protein